MLSVISYMNSQEACLELSPNAHQLSPNTTLSSLLARKSIINKRETQIFLLNNNTNLLAWVKKAKVTSVAIASAKFFAKIPKFLIKTINSAINA